VKYEQLQRLYMGNVYVQYTVPVYLSSILQESFQNNFPGHHSGNDGKAAL